MISPSDLAEAQEYARTRFASDATGHDYYHTQRVARLARRIAQAEGAQAELAELAAWLHDVDDHKISPATHKTLGNARAFLSEHQVDANEQERVLTAIREVSFSHNVGKNPSTLEAACVRDADRLDAMGAIGVARTFAFGGAHHRAMYDPHNLEGSTIGHFYEKLLLLKDLMCTETGRRLAEERDAFLRAFLDAFLSEWEG